MTVVLYPGPNNEIVPEALPDTSSRFPVDADFAVSSSHSETSSFTEGEISSASYSIFAETASLLIGTIDSASWANKANHADSATSASYSTFSSTSSYGIFSQVTVTGSGGGIGYMYVARMDNISSATIIDAFTSSLGNSSEWIISINDGFSFKTSQILSVWNPTTSSINWSEITTNAIGVSPYALSVNLLSNQIELFFNPASGSWTIKVIRFVI